MIYEYKMLENKIMKTIIMYKFGVCVRVCVCIFLFLLKSLKFVVFNF